MKRRAAAVVRLTRAESLAFWGAAYLLSDRAFVSLDRRGAAWTACLRPKSGGVRGLRELFLAAYEDQRRRWAVERANLPVRAEVLRRALVLDETAGVLELREAAALSAERRAEIEKALAEGPVADPLGIRRAWEEGRKRA